MKEIRIGFVGAGWMGKAHSTAMLNEQMLFGPDFGVPVFEMVADNNEESAKIAQHKIGFRRMTTDWHELVTDPQIDLVDIATPNAFHYQCTADGTALICRLCLVGTASAVQPQSAIDMIVHLYEYGPLVIWGIVILILWSYKLDQLYPQIMRDLVQRAEHGED